MSAPDKIYTTPVGTYDTKPIPDLQDNIYISKDYLLEWAKGEQNKCSDETHPYAMFMNVVIDKLNEL